MKLTKTSVFLHYFSKFMWILLFVMKYRYISLLLKMINGLSWPAKIMASPFKIRWKNNNKKKKTFLELNILYMIKVTIQIFCDHFSSYLVWKTAKNPPNWKVKNCQFSKNSDIFLHLMLLLVPMPFFLNLQWEYVVQITDKHLYTMSNTIFIFIFERKMNKNEI